MAAGFDVACIGRAAVDLYGEQWGAPLEEVATFARYLGGSPANTAVGLARLGLRAAMVTRVGDEHNGRFVRERLAAEGVDVSQVRTDPDRLTALVFLAVRDRDEFPHIFYRERCADMGLAPEDIDPAFLVRCTAVLLSGTHLSQPGPRAACARAASLARGFGSRVVLDIDYRPVLWGVGAHGEGAAREAASAEATARYAEVLPLCDLVVGTEEEFQVAGGAADLMGALARVRALTGATLVVKRGPAGCVVLEGALPGTLEGGTRVPGFPVEVFNVLGAGDAFMAGFLAAWVRGAPAATAARQGNACGALVVSRHGCAPAMPSAVEVAHFIDPGPSTPRVREDARIEHLHRATTRPRLPRPLLVLAFDHRTQLESAASAQGAAPARIAEFKALLGEAVLRVAARWPGTGAIVDDRHGERVLPRLTGRGLWVARPVEAPGAIPLAFERGADLGLAMRAWPRDHVAKCLVAFDADDGPALRRAQVERLLELQSACHATGHELLLEVIPPPHADGTAGRVARALEALYGAGLRPDWWKLPPDDDPAAWSALDELIARHDPHCRGALVLGMEAGRERLAGSFRASAASRRVQGFAVGRSIWGEAARDWFAGTAGGAQVVERVAERYEDIISLWHSTRKETA